MTITALFRDFLIQRKIRCEFDRIMLQEHPELGDVWKRVNYKGNNYVLWMKGVVGANLSPMNLIGETNVVGAFSWPSYSPPRGKVNWPHEAIKWHSYLQAHKDILDGNDSYDYFLDGERFF